MEKVITRPAIFSFPALFTPTKDEKYEVTLCFPEGTDLKEVEEMVETTAAEAFPGKPKSYWKHPIRDGAEKEHLGEPYLPGTKFFTAKTKFAPGIIDRAREDVIDKAAVYPGVIGRAQIHTYKYDTDGNRGVGIGLDHIQLLKDGPRLGSSDGNGPTNAADQFDEVDIDDLM